MRQTSVVPSDFATAMSSVGHPLLKKLPCTCTFASRDELRLL